MSKKIIVFGVILSIAFLLVLILNFNRSSEVIYSEKSKQIINTNALTMMYETEANSGEYQVSSDTSWPQDGYTFNETLSRCENGGTLTWNSETNRVVMQANTSDKCYVYFDKTITLANYIINYVYTEDGENGLYYHDGVGTYGTLEAEDNSYRYIGANPNNYVCFGSDESTCPADNLYRIIGVFDGQVKLIKSESIGNYYWSSNGTGSWDNNTLNTVTLNDIYLNSFGAKWMNMISSANWYLSGTSYVVYKTTKEVFNQELKNYNSIYQDKIGLIYISDYTYATVPENWSLTIDSYSDSLNIDNNWLYLGISEWTITGYCCEPVKDTTIHSINSSGVVYHSLYNNNFAVRPTFYLNSDVQYILGIGTQDNPYLIS